MMCRNPLLLVLVVAGLSGGVAEPSALARTGTAPELAGPDAYASETFSRSTQHGASAVWQEGSAPVPRAPGSRSDLPARELRLSSGLSARDVAFEAARSAHLQYATPFALARTGLLSRRSTAPPSFRFV